ncbi:MAG: T9SS type A sorting domain-containing protein [Polaribacter sp.]|nr:T9SS type A sorting domain-containing protein [Polaribacter sp.]
MSNTIDNLNIFPNPTNISWKISSQNNISSIVIYDLLGKNVINITPNSKDAFVDATSIKSGIYLAQINTEKGILTKKLIKK